MKVVLKNRKSGEYFKSPAIWTEHIHEAFAFPDSATAMNFYMQHYMPDVEVVALVDNANKGVHMSLEPGQLPATGAGKSSESLDPRGNAGLDQ